MNKEEYKISCSIMWVIYSAVLLIIIPLIFNRCNGKNIESGKNTLIAESDSLGKGFKKIMIPDGLATPSQRADYLVCHYWDNFNFSDTAYIHLPDITEQAFVNYLEVMHHADKQKVYSSITAMMDRAVREDTTGKMYSYFLRLYKDYLYDPNSPMRDDEYYIPVVRYIQEDTISNTAVKEQAKFDLKMMLKNRKGDIARNIEYTLSDGTKADLYSLTKKYTILYFYNPDCYACKEITTYMEASPLVNRLLTSGMLDILALYTDEDLALWRKYISQIPPAWKNAREKKVRKEQLYDLRAIPSLYLLDTRKRVLLKDADITVIERFLQDSVENIEKRSD